MRGLSEARLPAECGQSFLLPGWRKQRNPLVKFNNNRDAFVRNAKIILLRKKMPDFFEGRVE